MRFLFEGEKLDLYSRIMKKLLQLFVPFLLTFGYHQHYRVKAETQIWYSKI